MRDRVVVEIEAEVGRLARDDHFALIDGIGVIGQGEEVWRLFGESLANGFARICGPAPIGSEAPAPGLSLRIEIIEIDERTGGEKALACEPYSSFDPTQSVNCTRCR